MTRYAPSRHYLTVGLVVVAMAAFSGWVGTRWLPAFVPCAVFLASAVVILFLGLQPPITIHETHLSIRNRVILWTDIKRLDRAHWPSPLIVRLTLADDSHATIIYSGDLDSTTSLLRHMRRYSREALIDGRPYRQFWGEALAAAPDRRQMPSPKYQLLRSDDEAEVERLYQRLKTVGHFDTKSTDE